MGHAAEGSAHDGANPVRIFGCRVEPCIAQRHSSGSDAELGEPVEPPNSTLFEMVLW
jgi:hypothetical protein